MTSSRPKKKLDPQRRYHHGDLKNSLLASARTMLERDGPAAISFREIARSAGVSQAAPYNHFRDKEHLLAVLAAIGFVELTDSQLAAARGGGERLEVLGRAYVDFACRNPQLYRLMFGGLISDWAAYEEAATAKELSFGPVKMALATELEARGESSAMSTETAAIAAWSLVHGLAMLLIDGALVTQHRAHGREKLVARVVQWFLGRTLAGRELAAPVAPTQNPTRAMG